ncbi:hypothetical protein E1A91_D09G049600v1 [Gossypium mustelinum]|uniref:Uncharacterized protein n=1 Tax=Gossypium mustelinum TaxID=34275 RepID=A0A5D2TFM2_GOSMU|nr:hypothetical protein E1A91_D09G049600v1 [Gossypium mustelinum]
MGDKNEVLEAVLKETVDLEVNGIKVLQLETVAGAAIRGIIFGLQNIDKYNSIFMN